MKFPGSHKIVGTVYSDMNCDESLRKIYANIAESKKSKKIDVYFSIVTNYCYQIDDSATKTFHAVIPNKYENVSWDETMTEILNRLPRMHSSLPLEVAIGIVIDTCRKAEELEKNIVKNWNTNIMKTNVAKATKCKATF